MSSHSLPSSFEPTSANQAVQILEWRDEMVVEFNKLVANGTWTLVLPSPSQNVVGNKWVFRVKQKNQWYR